MTQGGSCITACSALWATGLSAVAPVPLIVPPLSHFPHFMATQVKKCAFLMPFKKEENNSRFLCKNQTSEKALKYFDGAVTFTSNTTRIKVSDS